ncbi:MAG: hypothetical protein US35_C0014G0017 [Parcubacteria group bacterium GW2011_GWA2_37_10]|nr:MAG: hypothetical protein US35_C0014G0017 [Parcubacteria group bacterium GW2011_GWA2_37_10]
MDENELLKKVNMEKIASEGTAVEAAKKVHPDKVFFIVKIGYSAAEILSNMEKNPW